MTNEELLEEVEVKLAKAFSALEDVLPALEEIAVAVDTLREKMEAEAPPSPPQPIPLLPAPTILAFPIRKHILVIFEGWHESSRYERHQHAHVFKNEVTVRVQGFGLTASTGDTQPFRGNLKILVEDVLVGELPKTGVKKSYPVTFDSSQFSDGWHKLRIESDDSTESCIPMWAFFHNQPGLPEVTEMPVTVGSYDIRYGARQNEQGESLYHEAMVPTRWQPYESPLPSREAEEFNTKLGKKDLFLRQLIPVRVGTIHHPSLYEHGQVGEFIMTTASKQPYHFYNIFRKYPQLPSMDGPRGRGNTWFPMHMQVANNGGLIVVEPWRVIRVSPDGAIRTLVGWRHKQPPPYYAQTQDSLESGLLELVGDWSAIPAERHGIHEAWGLVWDSETVKVDESLPMIDGLSQHPKNPVYFISDTVNNRVLRVEADRLSHDTPHKVTEFITGLGDPWDIVAHARVLYISERALDRISMWNMDSGAFIGTFLSNSQGSFTTIDVTGRHERSASLSVPYQTARAEPCVAPEGLYIIDEELYYASHAIREVRRAPLNNPKGWEVLFEINSIDGTNSRFAKIAVSDGSFHPRGTVYVSTWSAVRAGGPEVHFPDGGAVGLLDDGPSDRAAGGKGCRMYPLGYGASMAVGKGRLFFAGSVFGIVELTKAQPSDPVIDHLKYQRGDAKWTAGGYDLTHDHGVWGHFGLELPELAQDEEVAYFLKQQEGVDVGSS